MKLDALNCTHYKVVDGKVAVVQVYMGDQYGADNFFWAASEAQADPGPPRRVARDPTSRKEQRMATPEVATGPMATVDRMYQCFGTGDMETLKNEVFAPDIQWALPGHHPLSGTKQGADEVLAFFGALMAVGVNVDNVSFGTIGDDRVVETHSGHGTVEGQDYLFPTCSVYTIRDGKIAHVQVYTADQHGVDDFFWRANALKPLPDRLA